METSGANKKDFAHVDCRWEIMAAASCTDVALLSQGGGIAPHCRFLCHPPVGPWGTGVSAAGHAVVEHRAGWSNARGGPTTDQSWSRTACAPSLPPPADRPATPRAALPRGAPGPGQR